MDDAMVGFKNSYIWYYGGKLQNLTVILENDWFEKHKEKCRKNGT